MSSTLVLSALAACTLHAAWARAPQPVKTDFGTIAVCEDDNEWPPYNFYRREGAQKTADVVGFSVDVLREIAQKRGLDVKIDLIPWQRCVALATIGKSYQMSMNVSPNPERERAFLLTRPYYSTTNYYFYSRKRHPQGLPVNSVADLRQQRVCGIQGFNYSYYGLGPQDVDSGARSFDAMIAKLHLGRCSLFLEKLEVMQGYGAIGKTYLADPDLGRAPVPGMPSVYFHIAISRNYAKAAALRDLFDQELSQMESSGRLQALWARYAPH